MKKVELFFLYCSGASLPLLKRCPTESSRYVGIGAMIFFTGLLAAISSAYAFHFIFDGIYLPISFGLVWALMIFNLDRFIVLSLRKSGQARKEMLQALPRFILAIVIALVISKPLELKIFENEIQTELTFLKQEIIQSQGLLIDQKYHAIQDSLKSEQLAVEQNVLDAQAKRDQLVDLARQEADGTGGSGKRNPGPIYAIKNQNAQLAQVELDQLQAEIKPVLLSIQSQMQNNEAQKADDKSAVVPEKLTGISFQLTALHRLGEKYETIYWANVFIILLFIVLETAPIMTKLISSKGPYDDLLSVREYKFHVYAKRQIHQETEELDEILGTKS